MTTKNIVPQATGEGTIGTTLKRWLTGFFNTIDAVTYNLNGAALLDTDGALAANSDARVATQKAVKTYADLKLLTTRYIIIRLDSLVTTTSLTAADITGFTVAVAANEVVQFEVYLNNGNTGTTGNKFAVNFPSGGTLVCHVDGSTSGPTARTQSKITAAATLTTEIYHLLASQVGRATIRGTFKNGATPGNLVIQYAAVTSGTVTINAGSFLKVLRMASATAF